MAASGFLMEPGGKGLNVAVGLRRLGASVHLLMGVGLDHAGNALQDLLQHEGLDRRLVHTFDVASGHGAGLIDPSGDHVIVVHPGANHQLTAAHAEAAQAEIAESKLVYGQFEVPDAVLEAAFRLGRRAGVRTVLNPSPWRPIDEGLLAHTDTLLLNEHEAAALFSLEASQVDDGIAWLGSTQAWRKAHPGIELLITLGAEGCLSWPAGADTPHRQASHPVDAVDSTGCGDAFAAAWCFARARGDDDASALALATSAGAWLAARPGVIPALPTLAALQAGAVPHS